MNWDEIVNKATPYVVRIETPGGSGSGFLCAYNDRRSFCAIATALHVVADADDWQQPIRIHNHNSTAERFLKESERVIFRDRQNNDSAVIFFAPEKLDLPETLIELFPLGTPLSIGAEIGWLGFPGIVTPNTPCFFSGNISAVREGRNAYWVDGVAINGVSGGPVLHSSQADGVRIVGVVSAYRANRLTGDVLPGLLIAQDVSHFHDVVQSIKDLDEATKKRSQIKAAESAAPAGSS